MAALAGTRYGGQGMRRRVNRFGLVRGAVPGGLASGTLAAIVVLAACSGAPSRTAARAPAVKPPPPVTMQGYGTVSATLPGCTTATQRAPELPRSLVTLTRMPLVSVRVPARRRATLRLPSMPFGVAVMPDDHWGFVALDDTVGVVRIGAAGPARLIREIGANTGHGIMFALAGAVLTPDGRYLLAVNHLVDGITVISTAAAEHGGKDPVLGQVTVPGGRIAGVIEVTVTPDGRYAFVSEEGADKVAVFNLSRALAGHYGTASYVGAIPTQFAPVGLAVSPDGKWLYSTSEATGTTGNVGSLSVISVARAETDPAHSVITRVPAGCNPVRVITSDDGRVVWVTARASDALLAFSASALADGSRHPLLASIRVGELPVGIGVARDGQLLVIADSDRFDIPGEHPNLAVVDVADVLAGRPALLGYLPSGAFPRDIASGPGGQLLLVANFASNQLETVRLDSLP